MNRLLYPAIGVLLIIVAALQMRAGRTEPVRSKPHGEAQTPPARVVAEGRIATYPGGEVAVGTDISGRIQTIAVIEQQRVRKGDLLVTVNADDTVAALAEARARVKELEADIRLYETEAARARELFDAAVGSRQAWDKALRDVDAARARKVSALAEVERLEAVLAKSRIVSPIDGVVIERHVDRGENVVEGDRLVTVADIDRVRVETEVDEYDAARIVLGGNVTIIAEGYAQRWRGTVEEIPHSVVSRRINPPDPSKPIDTRVLVVKVAMSEPSPLKLGQRVEVSFE